MIHFTDEDYDKILESINENAGWCEYEKGGCILSFSYDFYTTTQPFTLHDPYCHEEDTEYCYNVTEVSFTNENSEEVENDFNPKIIEDGLYHVDVYNY